MDTEEQCEKHKKKFSLYCENCHKMICEDCLDDHMKPPLSHQRILQLENVVSLLEDLISFNQQKYQKWLEDNIPRFTEQVNIAHSFLTSDGNEELNQKLGKVSQIIKKLEIRVKEKIESLTSDMKVVKENTGAFKWKDTTQLYKKAIETKENYWPKLMKKQKNINNAINLLINETGKAHLQKIQEEVSSKKKEMEMALAKKTSENKQNISPKTNLPRISSPIIKLYETPDKKKYTK